MNIDDHKRQRRQVGAVLAGLLALAAGGVVAGAFLAGTPCDDLLPAASDAAQARIDVPAVVGPAVPGVDALEVSRGVLAAGDVLGLGPLRGALPSAPTADLVAFEDGVYAVLDDDLRVVESGLVAVATGRDAEALRRAVAVGDHELGVIRSDGQADDLVARYDEDLRQGGCRALEEPGTVVRLDAGVAIVDRGGDVETVRLDGGSLWRDADLLGSAATDGAVTGLQAIVSSDAEVVAVDLRSGEERWRLAAADLGTTFPDDALLVAGDDLVVVATADGHVRVDGETGAVVGSLREGTPATAGLAAAEAIYVVSGDRVLRLTEGTAEVQQLPAPVRQGDQVLAEREGTLLVATVAGLVRFGDGATLLDERIPATALATSDDYTAVTTDLGSGVTFLFGPVGAPAGSPTS